MTNKVNPELITMVGWNCRSLTQNKLLIHIIDNQYQYFFMQGIKLIRGQPPQRG